MTDRHCPLDRCHVPVATQQSHTRRMYMSARLEADVASNQAASLSAQVAACQASEDRATALWQAAERAKQAVVRGVAQRDAAAAAFALERMQAQVRWWWSCCRLCFDRGCVLCSTYAGHMLPAHAH